MASYDENWNDAQSSQAGVGIELIGLELAAQAV
jgi:hypothetical protein